MSKFKVGDRVRVMKPGNKNHGFIGVLEYTDALPSWGFSSETDAKMPDPKENLFEESELQLIKGDKKMARRTFRLLKETPRFKKGLLVQEACDDGDQQYDSLNQSNYEKMPDYKAYFGSNITKFTRKEVENQPKWFVEVFQPGDNWFTKEEVQAFRAFVKKPKKAKKK